MVRLPGAETQRAQELTAQVLAEIPEEAVCSWEKSVKSPRWPSRNHGVRKQPDLAEPTPPFGSPTFLLVDPLLEALLVWVMLRQTSWADVQVETHPQARRTHATVRSFRTDVK